MLEAPGSWIAVGFFVGLLTLVAVGTGLGLYRKAGIAHQRRNLYQLLAAVFFGVIAIVLPELETDLQWSAAAVARALVFGAFVTAVAIWWTRRNYSRHIVDGVFVKRDFPRKWFFVVYVVSFVPVQSMVSAGQASVIWPYLLGGTLAFLLLSIFSYWHVMQLERNLGHRLMEAE